MSADAIQPTRKDFPLVMAGAALLPHVAAAQAAPAFVSSIHSLVEISQYLRPRAFIESNPQILKNRRKVSYTRRTAWTNIELNY
jgi:hypothetical protein